MAGEDASHLPRAATPRHLLLRRAATARVVYSIVESRRLSLQAITAPGRPSFRRRRRRTTRLDVLPRRLGSYSVTFVALFVSRTLSFPLCCSDVTNEALTLHWLPFVSKTRTMERARFKARTPSLLGALLARRWARFRRTSFLRATFPG